jgi:hypothetical protein
MACFELSVCHRSDAQSKSNKQLAQSMLNVPEQVRPSLCRVLDRAWHCQAADVSKQLEGYVNTTCVLITVCNRAAQSAAGILGRI